MDRHLFTFFFPDMPLSSGEQYTLPPQESHHLVRVLRRKIGETLRVINGKGDIALSSVITLDVRGTTLQQQTIEHFIPMPLLLFIGIGNKERLEWLIEKGTELGVTEFHLSSHPRIQLERLHHISISALKQSCNPFLPSIHLIANGQNVLDPNGSIFWCDSDGKSFDQIETVHFPIQFIVGPEKGFSSDEKKELKKTAQAIRLHRYLLRSETAALVALSQIQLKL